jgi:hypothetical protein
VTRVPVAVQNSLLLQATLSVLFHSFIPDCQFNEPAQLALASFPHEETSVISMKNATFTILVGAIIFLMIWALDPTPRGSSSIGDRFVMQLEPLR